MVKMQPMNPSQLQSAIDAARPSPRDYVMLILASNHAMRATEIARLLVSDINLKDRTIRIVRLKNSLTTVEALLPAEFEAVQSWLNSKASSPRLFPSSRGDAAPLSNVQVYRLFRKYAEAAGLPDVSRGPHAWKHSLLQNLADRGMSIKMLQLVGGHRNINSTAQYFSHPQSVIDSEKARLLA
jgi:type 1 fimbriae regulatory protein FimB